MRNYITFLAAILVCSSVDAQTRHSAVTEHRAGEMSFAIACRKANEFLGKLGVASSSIDAKRCQIYRPTVGPAHYIVQTKGRFLLTVDLVSGRILTAYNMGRRDEQYRKRNRTGHSRFETEAEAKNFLRALATHLGIPETARCVSFGNKPDGTIKDANSSGSVWANYRMPGKEYYQIEVDPQDGAFVAYRHILVTPS